MRCPKCKFENPENNKFCGQCGYELRLAAEGENKIITVLFAAVVNYSGMSEKLAPETIKQIMQDCFKLLIEQVQKYGGTVDQLLGDGLMALFGAPLAYEDHAQRACYKEHPSHLLLPVILGKKELPEIRELPETMRDDNCLLLSEYSVYGPPFK